MLQALLIWLDVSYSRITDLRVAVFTVYLLDYVRMFPLLEDLISLLLMDLKLGRVMKVFSLAGTVLSTTISNC